MGNYNVVVANVVGSATSSNATLQVNSTMSAALTPTNNATAVCYDTPLYMAFDRVPVERGVGKINIYNVTNTTTPVDTINTAGGVLQPRAVAGDSNGPFNLYPIIITSNTVAIYPDLDVLSSNQTYYVTVDPGTFTDTNGAYFAGITDTNAWRFTTKPTGPANPNNVTVAYDGSGDFCTVQGAVDSLPNGNTTPTLVNIRNGTYTEFVDTRFKNNITFRGQSRAGTIVQYPNNYNNNTSTHTRMSFKVFSNDIAIENMTVANTTPQGGSQAEALMLDTGAARFILNNAEVDSRQDTILANVNSSQGYFYNSLIKGNFDYVWGGGNLFITNCEFRTIPTASSYNLTAPRTDNGPTGPWLGPDGNYASNGMSFVNCLLTRQDTTVTNITVTGSNGAADGNAAFISCNIDTNYIHPIATVTNTYILWEYNNSNLNNTATISLGLVVLTNGDARLACASSATCWLNNWVPQLAPNILTKPVSVTVTAGVNATFSVVATGIPDPTYQWQIGGSNLVGQTSSTLTVSNAHCADAGAYSVIVSNIAGVVTSSNATLTVIGTAPVASFTAGPQTSGTEPLSVTFTDTSTGSPISLVWNFGDLSSTTTTGGATVVHAYAAGTYTVTLTASNACDISTLVSNNMISVIASPAAGFSSTTPVGLAPWSVTFNSTSTGTTPITLYWDLGDGTLVTNTDLGSGAIVGPHLYAAGVYTVTLIASNAAPTISTNVQNRLVWAQTSLESWQEHYFSATNGAALLDALSASGVPNSNELAAGFSPINAATYLHVIKIVKSGGDMNVTYLGANGDNSWSPGIAMRTNILEFTTGSPAGDYSNNFATATASDNQGTNILSGGAGTGTVVTVTDTGGATGATRYYRIRVLAP
jgi:PKD repeat protein